MKLQDAGVWKSGKGKGRRQPKGRQTCDESLSEVRMLLGDRPRRRDLLIEHLHLIQDDRGHLSARLLRALAEEMRLSQAEVFEVATFYAHFDVVKEDETPPPALTVRVCDSLSCELAGAEGLIASLRQRFDPADLRIVRAPCMGRCDGAPTIELGHRHIDCASASSVALAVSNGDVHATIPAYQGLEDYLADGGYTELKALEQGERTVQDIQDELRRANLRGCGGAGFPAWRKWSFVRAESEPRYLAVNADEGEPGTFKDRYFLEREPHVFLEGMLIAARAVSADKVFIYLRDEYPVARLLLLDEIAKLEKSGIVSTGFIDLRRGAGAYICGEESAMIESIEGKRGLPRHRPPYVAQNGVFGRPTLVHNVETLYWVGKICREGSQIFASVEHNGRIGLRSYSVSGRVAKPGIYILPAGSTILEVIEAAGGMADGHIFKAYQPGGPSSGLLPASHSDLPLDFDILQEHGSFIGSAAIVVLSQEDSAKDAALNMLRFFEDESCGQCTPCRVGCGKAVLLMKNDQWDISLLEELGEAMEDASICGLGQAAPNAIRLTAKHFPQEVGG